MLPQAVRPDRQERRPVRPVKLSLEISPLVCREIRGDRDQPPFTVIRARRPQANGIWPHRSAAEAAARLVVDTRAPVDGTLPAIRLDEEQTIAHAEDFACRPDRRRCAYHRARRAAHNIASMTEPSSRATRSYDALQSRHIRVGLFVSSPQMPHVQMRGIWILIGHSSELK